MSTQLRKWIGCPAGWARGLAVGLLLLAWGCDASNGPAGPSSQDPGGPSPQNPVGITYDRVTPHHNATLSHHGTLSERYILLTDGKFRLQFVSGVHGTFEYLGTYHSSGSTVSFAFNGSTGYAAGTLSGDSLFVRYDLDMILSDFENGVFVRSP